MANMRVLSNMYLSIVILASLAKGEVFIEHPEISLKAPAVFGKTSTPTPEGIYTVTKATNSKLGRLLVFRKEGNAVWAIHTNLKSRHRALASETSKDNYLSAGCIGVSEDVMDKLWNQKSALILQVY